MVPRASGWRSIIATFSLVTALTVCGCSPINYAQGVSARDLPNERTRVFFESIIQAKNLMGSEDRPQYQDLIKREMFAKLGSEGFSVVENKQQCPNCISLRAIYYYRSWNPITGGEASVHVTAVSPDGKELFTTVAGKNFGPLHSVILGGDDGIMQLQANHAAEYVANELKGKPSIAY